MNGRKREYQLLLSFMVNTNKDMQSLQTWTTSMCDSAKQHYQRGEFDAAAAILYETVCHQEARLQQLQRAHIRAQMMAEHKRLRGDY